MAAPLAQEQRRGIGDVRQAAVGHLEHADLVGRAEAVLHRAQDAELVAALALEIEHRVDHVLEHAGAGDGAVLGDVADQQDRDAAPLGELDQRLRRGAHLAHRARRAVDRVEPHGLDRIDHRHLGRVGPLQGRHDVAHRGRGGELHRRVAQAQPLGRAGAPGRAPPRRRCRRRPCAGAPAPPRPAAAASTCRCRDRRRSAAPSPPPGRRRRRGRTRRCRSGSAAAAASMPRRPANSSVRPLPARAMPPPAGPGAGAASSTMVFHSPQDSQRPPHLLVTAPHDWQTKRFSGLAISAARAWTGTSRRDAASTNHPSRAGRGAGCARACCPAGSARAASSAASPSGLRAPAQG